MIVHCEELGLYVPVHDCACRADGYVIEHLHEMYGISRLGNHDVLNAPDYSTELGDRKGYAKQGKIYGGRHFCWESRQESRSFCRLY